MNRVEQLNEARLALEALLAAPVRDQEAIRNASRLLKKAMGYQFYEDVDVSIKRHKEERGGFESGSFPR